MYLEEQDFEILATVLGLRVHDHQGPGFGLVLAVDGADIDTEVVGPDAGGAVKFKVYKLVGQLLLQHLLHVVRCGYHILPDTISAGPNSDLPGNFSISLQKLFLLILKQEVI